MCWRRRLFLLAEDAASLRTTPEEREKCPAPFLEVNFEKTINNCRSDFRVVKVKACEAVKKSDKACCG